jgi:hypothetical protein
MAKMRLTSSTPCNCYSQPMERPELGSDIVECPVCNHRWYRGRPQAPLENPDFSPSEEATLFDPAPYVDLFAKRRGRR